MIKKAAKTVIIFLLFLIPMCLSASAKNDIEAMEYYDEYRAMLDALPEDVSQLLPSELYSESVTDIASGAAKMTDFGYIVNAVFDFLGLELEGAIKLFASLMGVLILAATMNAVKTSFSSSGVNDAFSMCASCAVFVIAVLAEYSIVRSVAEFFNRICALANAMIPLMGALYAMGGNVGSAVVNHSSLMIFMSVVENFCAKTVLPVSGVCMAFAAASALLPDMSLGGLSGSFKKLYTNTLTFVMMIFATVMGAQNLLASKADTIAGKTAKFAIGNLIPVVGSALAGTVGTVSFGVEYIRSSVGVIGIILVALMLLPTIITLLVTKLALSLSSGAADILGCGREGRIISELSGINGFLLAAACICSVTFIFMLTLFTKCSSAIGGGI